MEKVDLKDKKILYQLDLNSRQSNAQIGKKVGLSREMINYRIKRMEEKGIITGYWTAINTYKLGYYVFRIYINLIDVSKKTKMDIIDYFVKNEDSWAVLTMKGPVDLDVVLWVKDIYNFNQYWINTLQIYGKYFAKSTISILTDVLSCKKTYLLNNDADLSDRLFYKTNCEGKPVQIDEIDYQILDSLALNARMPLIDLSNRSKCSSQAINYRIKNLMKKNIIQAFRVSIDISKLSMQNCSIDLYLKDQTKRNQIVKYIIKKSNIYDIMTMNIGWADLQFQTVINNIDELTLIVDDIEKKFPDTIRRYDYWMSENIHKERWLPKMNKTDFASEKKV